METECVKLGGGRPWAPRGYVSLGRPVGGHSNYSVESGIITKCFRQLVSSGLLCNHKNVNILFIIVLPNRYAKKASDSGSEGFATRIPLARRLSTHLSSRK